MGERTTMHGEGWVTVASVVPRPEEIGAIDPILLGVSDLWDRLEMHEEECGGAVDPDLDAFNFEASAVQKAVPPGERASMVARLQTVERHVTERPEAYFFSARLASRMHRLWLLDLLQELQVALTAPSSPSLAQDERQRP